MYFLIVCGWALSIINVAAATAELDWMVPLLLRFCENEMTLLLHFDPGYSATLNVASGLMIWSSGWYNQSPPVNLPYLYETCIQQELVAPGSEPVGGRPPSDLAGLGGFLCLGKGALMCMQFQT